MERQSYNKGPDLTGAALPRPRQAGSIRLTLLAILAVVILCGFGWWLMRSPAERNALREQAADSVGGWLDGTPLARFANLLRPAPPPLPQEVLHPQTTPGTLAGTEINATVAAPLDFDSPLVPREGAADNQGGPDIAGGASGPGQQVMFDQEPLAPVSEDSRLQPGYVTGLAQWLVSRYHPGARGGLSASVQSLNQAAGGKLAAYAQGGRSGLLRYAFHPAMIEGLYALYGNRFLAELNSAAEARGLNGVQNQQLHRSVAGQAALLASCLDGILRVPDVAGKLAHIDNLAQKAVDANADLTTAVFELDELREARASQQARTTAQLRVDGATARYRRASDEHARAQTALATEIRKHSGQNLDEDSLLFLAAWVARRYAEGGQARGAVQSCVTVLRDLSARCANAGGIN